MMRVLSPLAFCLTLALTLPASAQVPPPVMDQVVLDLTAEDWVGTETARVTVSADAAASGADAGTQRSDLLKAIGGLAKGGPAGVLRDVLDDHRLARPGRRAARAGQRGDRHPPHRLDVGAGQ